MSIFLVKGEEVYPLTLYRRLDVYFMNNIVFIIDIWYRSYYNTIFSIQYKQH